MSNPETCQPLPRNGLGAPLGQNPRNANGDNHSSSGTGLLRLCHRSAQQNHPSPQLLERGASWC
eukprot:9889737-Lingulodinium_polyedra.AAC.1